MIIGCIALCVAAFDAEAVEWTTAELSGEFTGIGGDTQGTGLRSYSFALRRTIEQGGYLMFSLNFHSWKETAIDLAGGSFLDLGALFSPPTSVCPPRSFPDLSSTRAQRFPCRQLLLHDEGAAERSLSDHRFLNRATSYDQEVVVRNHRVCNWQVEFQIHLYR